MTNEDTSIDLSIQIEEFEKQKKEAQKRFNEEYTNDEQNSVYMWEDLWLDYSEEEVEGNTLKISGSLMTQDDKCLGNINLRVPLNFDKLIDIFQGYIKKLNKVKTVMETVKEE